MRAYYAFIETLCTGHTIWVAKLDLNSLRHVVMTLKEGLDSLDILFFY